MSVRDATAQPNRAERTDKGPPGGGDPLLVLLGSIRARLCLALAVGAVSGILGVAGLVLVGFALDELFTADPSGIRVAWLLIAAGAVMIGRFAMRKWAFDLSHLASFVLETTPARSGRASVDRAAR
ncbi:hypothetical protein [Streptomyces synnematoformans]|uniref:ABC transporter ATP-binding protein n=1 Tax=Streptomyces synnematoformans TaxID=415721 RepID=A0ABN2X8C8_9ACTN